jgi:hypothetical protein
VPSWAILAGGLVFSPRGARAFGQWARGERKIAKGYPQGNTMFEDTCQACLYQNGQLAMKADITQAQALADRRSEVPRRATRPAVQHCGPRFL